MKNGSYELVIAPVEYPGKKYRDRYCYQHILIWWQNTGIIPKPNEVIHHKNGDTFDNRFENLELKTRDAHSSDHGKNRSCKMVRLKCPSCGKIFDRQKRQTHLSKQNRATFCSRACVGKFSHKGRIFENLPKIKKDKIRENVVKEYII